MLQNQQLLHQKQQKMLFKLQQVLAKQKIVLHYKKQTLKTQMMDTLKAKTIKIHKKIKQNHYHKLVKNQIKI